MVHWGQPAAHLKLGWELPKTEFKLGEQGILKLHLRVVDPGVVVRVTSNGYILQRLYSIGVAFGPTRTPVLMTQAGIATLDPERSMGTQGASMKGEMRKIDEVPVSEWWDLSRPGDYFVSVRHPQPLPSSEKYAVVTAPEVQFRIVSD